MTKSNMQRQGGTALALAGAAILGACAYPYQPTYAPAYNPPPNEVRGSVTPRANYGIVSSIERLQAEPRQASPVGAIAGAVIGGLLGNQIGAGNGKAVATVAGVAGGALAGNEIGRRAETGSAPDLFRVSVRYDNGGTQYIDVDNPGDLRPGDRVRVEGNGQISRY